MQPFDEHCVIRIQLFRPITAIQRHVSVRQSKLSDILNLIFIAYVLFCLFRQAATAQEIHIPEPVPPPAEVSEAENLSISVPRTVRLIYFRPNDRPYRQEVVDSMKTVIQHTQTFYTEQMLSHGYEETTFHFETDEQGEPLIHILNGQYSDSHYLNITYDRELVNEHNGKLVIADEFSLPINNIYFIVFDFVPGGGIPAVGGSYGKNSGAVQCFNGELILDASKSANISLYDGEYNFRSVLHELGHAFGLKHDWRDGAYIMSYGPPRWNRLSACAADFLAIHPYFNPDIPTEDTPPPVIELISPLGYPAGSTSVPIRLKVNDPDGLHQVLLFAPGEISNTAGLNACQRLNGQQDTIIEFDYDGVISPTTDPQRVGTSLSNPPAHLIHIAAVDLNGDTGFTSFELFDISTRNNHIITLEHDRSQLGSVAFSSDNTTLASAALDGTLKLWDVASQENIVFERYGSGTSAVAFSPDSTILAYGLWDGTLKLWDVASQENIAVFEGNGNTIGTVAFSPDGTILAFTTSDDKIKLWEVASQQNIATFEGDGDIIGAISPDNTMLASIGFWDSPLKLWDVASQENIAVFEGDENIISAVAFSPDSTILASASWGTVTDKPTVKLWDVATQTNIATFEGHRDAIISIAYSPDGTMLASGTTNGVIRLWDVGTKHNIATFTTEGAGWAAEVWAVRFSHDGALLASVRRNSTVDLWRVSPSFEPPTTNISITGPAAAGPKIEGPWLWMLVPTDQKTEAKPSALRKDNLAAASNGAVTEVQIATEGVTEGDRVGNKVWTLGKLSPTSGDNMNEMANTTRLGEGYIDYHIAYGAIVLESPQEQRTWMYAGSDDNHKVWLNGALVHEQLNWHWAHDYQEPFQVTLKKGKNVLLVAVEDGAGAWSGFFGFETDAVYRILPPPLREDVNQDNIVNILDLLFVAAHFGEQGENVADVNRDNIVNIVDLTLVAAALGNTAAAPEAAGLHPDTPLTRALLQQWLQQAHQLNRTDATFQRGILILERLLAALTPRETILLPNYPNPFNPETWIPYQLAVSSGVSISIYAADGKLVRTFDLGHQPIGIYEVRSRAAYWDGRNTQGELVASGIYFYTFTAGDFSATRKMLIKK